MTEVHVPGSAQESLDESEMARRYDEKRRLLEAHAGKPEAKVVFREAYQEHVEEKFPIAVTPPTVSTVVSDGHRVPPTNVSPTARDELKELVATALEKGIMEAIAKAKARSPFLIDALHDELIDHYFDKLVAAGKVKVS